MIVCIDSNVLIQASRKGHPLSVIFTAWFNRRFLWAVSTDILKEYEEVLTRQSGRHRWEQLARVLDLAEARGDLLVLANPSFQFRVIELDPDDNKFTDCAITVGADYILTDDAHFSALKSAGYKPQPIAPATFIERYLEHI